MSNPPDYRNPASSITLQSETEETRDLGDSIGGEMNRTADKRERGMEWGIEVLKDKRTKMKRMPKDKT